MTGSLTGAGARLRDHFMGWQCRIRQHAVRREQGRPSDGMCPVLTMADGEEAGRITVVIFEREPEAATAQFRHIVQRTNDPGERFGKAVAFLAAAYFQKARQFEPRPFALFGPASPVATTLVGAGRCVLSFRQFSQSYRLPCLVDRLDDDDVFAEALYWHNAMFNPGLPPATMKLAFAPVWDEATAFPPVS